jgi:hypothetical protein
MCRMRGPTLRRARRRDVRPSSPPRASDAPRRCSFVPTAIAFVYAARKCRGLASTSSTPARRKTAVEERAGPAARRTPEGTAVLTVPVAKRVAAGDRAMPPWIPVEMQVAAVAARVVPAALAVAVAEVVEVEEAAVAAGARRVVTAARATARSRQRTVRPTFHEPMQRTTLPRDDVVDDGITGDTAGAGADGADDGG